MRPGYTAKRLADFGGALKLRRPMEERERWPRERLAAHQRERVGAIVRHAAARSPFYAERLRGVDVDGDVELAALPTLDKATLMERWDDIVTDRRLRLADVERHLDGIVRDEYLHGEYRAMATGGTTGRRGVFVFNRPEWSQALATFLRMSGLVGIAPHLPRRRLASIFAANPVHMTARFAATTAVGMHRMERLDVRTPIPELARRLEAFRPEVLTGYPSCVALLAHEQLEGRLRIAPRAVLTTSEVRTDEMTAAIREAWGVEPFNVYGITEGGIAAVDCPEHRGLHAFEDLVAFEVVDAGGRPVPEGERGDRLLLTNLYNRTLPLIRYELSDMVVWDSSPCACGRTLGRFLTIAGRTDDVLHLAGRRGGTVAVHPHALRSPLARCTAVKQYRMVHDEAGLDVQVVLRAGAAPDVAVASVRAALDAGLQDAGAEPPTLQIAVVEEIARADGPAAKHKLIESRDRQPA